jgi:hypothetical protein
VLPVLGSETLQGVGETNSEHKIFGFMFGRHFGYIEQFCIDMTLPFYCLKLRVFVCAHNNCQKFAYFDLLSLVYVNESQAVEARLPSITQIRLWWSQQGCIVISSVTSLAGSGILNEIVLYSSTSEILNHRLGYLWQFHISWRFDSFLQDIYIRHSDTKEFCRKTLQISNYSF